MGTFRRLLERRELWIAGGDEMGGENRKFSDLLIRARNGDEEARRELFSHLSDDERFFRVLFAMVRRLFPRTHSARAFVESQDIVQSAIFAGMQNIDGFRGTSEAEFYGWFRMILRSKLNRVVRRKKLASDDLEPSTARGAQCTAEDEQPLAQLLTEELRHELLDAIGSLPPDQRLVIELRLRGANSTQIGGILQIKPATVRKRESRAIERLRQLVN